MNYYKIIKDGRVVDANDTFLRWQEKHQTMLVCEPERGQFIQSRDQTIYRVSWLNPAPESVAEQYEMVEAKEIGKDEYDALVALLSNNEPIEDTEQITAPEEEPTPPTDPEIQQLKELKIESLNKACGETIAAGFFLSLEGAGECRFAMKDEDQIAMILLLSRAQAGEDCIDFYAADRKCLTLSTEDAIRIGNTAIAFRSYHVAYYRCAAAWVESMEDTIDIASVSYGTVIPLEFRSEFLIKYATALGVSDYAAH